MKLCRLIVLATVACLPALARAHVNENPLLTKVMLDRLEWSSGDHSEGVAWDIETWAGWNLRKFRLESEGEKPGGDRAEGQVKLSYSWAVSPYWDLQIGSRHDFGHSSDQNWLAFGLRGLAPYFLESGLSLYVDADGATAFSLEVEKELLLTQRWVLSPEVELQAFGQNDGERDQGSGLAAIEVGLRLGYEIRREFAPYIGVSWERALGNSAGLRRSRGDHEQEVLWSLGVRGWF